MTTLPGLDRERIRKLFDLRQRGDARVGDQVYSYTDDPHPVFHELRSAGPVHEGTVHELLGFPYPATFQALPEPDRRHFSVFDFATCDQVFRDEVNFPSSPEPIQARGSGGTLGNGMVGGSGTLAASMLGMNGPQHRRYRALVQPSFVPKKAEWWIAQWIQTTVDALIDGFIDDGKAELNVDFDAAIPVLTITGSFGIAVDDALSIRESLGTRYNDGVSALADFLMPIIEDRRANPQDDLISVLCQAEVDDDGVHRLDDDEIFAFSHLLLAAGSGTTWKQMGITLTALLTNPEILKAVRDDRSLLRPAIEESLRWNPTDPMFSRYTGADVELCGVEIPKGSVVHLTLGAANRDPAKWDDPDRYDPWRALRPTLGFGGGPHLCLGQHVARAELHVAIDALLTRLPNLRLDPDAPPPTIIGMYERGPTEINALWG
jgi:cytochrome P450